MPVRNAGYIPDASKLADLSGAAAYEPKKRENIFYEGFDGADGSETVLSKLYDSNQSNVKITQIKYEGSAIVKASETAAHINSGNEPRVAGTRGVTVTLDPAFASFDEPKLMNHNQFLMEIRLTEAQVKAMQDSQNAGIEPQLGFAYTARSANVKLGEEFFSPAGIDGGTAFLARKDLTAASEGCWALASTACGKSDGSEGDGSSPVDVDENNGRLTTIRYLEAGAAAPPVPAAAAAVRTKRGCSALWTVIACCASSWMFIMTRESP